MTFWKKPHPPHPPHPHQQYVTHPELEQSLQTVKRDIANVKKGAVTPAQLAAVRSGVETSVNGLAARVGDLEVAVAVLQADVAALMALIS